MFISPQNPVPEAHPVDAVFALMTDERSGSRMPSELGSVEIKDAKPPGPPPLDPPTPPPDVAENQDLRVAYEWLQSERSRLEEYTRVQFEKVEQQHRELMALHFQREQDAALQAQEINREIQRLASFSENLDERAGQLGERQKDLDSQDDKLAAVREEVRAFQQTRQTLQQEIDSQRSLIEQSLTRTNELREQARLLDSEIEAQTATLAERRRSWEEKEAETAENAARIQARVHELNERDRVLTKRQTDLAKAAEEVVALVQRRAGMEKEIQAQLTVIDELRGRTTRLRDQEETARKAAAAWETRVNESRETWQKKEADLATRYQQLENRYQSLERSEEALKRRMTELDETECRVESEHERQEKQLAMDCREIDRLRGILREHGLDPESHTNVSKSRLKRKAIRVE